MPRQQTYCTCTPRKQASSRAMGERGRTPSVRRWPALWCSEDIFTQPRRIWGSGRSCLGFPTLVQKGPFVPEFKNDQKQGMEEDDHRSARTGDSRCAGAGPVIASRPMMLSSIFLGIPLCVRAGALCAVHCTKQCSWRCDALQRRRTSCNARYAALQTRRAGCDAMRCRRGGLVAGALALPCF